MYRIIIVDDEPGAQEILAEYINKFNQDFRVMACLSDGEEALEYIACNEVDLIITDIRMPRMSGLELAQKLHECKPHVKVLIVSGYSEFEYAKKAIEFNVFNYLLKPIDVEELIECLGIIKNVLDGEREKDLYVAEMLLLQREQFFADLFMGALSAKPEIAEAFEKLDFPFRIADTSVKVLTMELQHYSEFLKNNWHHGKEKLGMAVLNIIEKVIPDVLVYPASHKGEKMVFVLFGANGSEGSIDTHMITGEIRSAIDLDIHIASINSFDNLFQMAENTAVEDNENEILMLLISHIKSGDEEGAKNILDRLAKNITEDRASEKKEVMVGDVVAKMISYFEHEYAGTVRLEPDLKNTQKTPESVLHILTDNYSEEEDIVINKAKAFIKANYMKDISREDVANYVFLNSAYLGKYFKQRTGKTISDYLLEVRMQKALELLNVHVKIAKISEMVGYKNHRHFFRVFKGYSGYTPKEYRRKVLKMEDWGDEDEG